MKTQQTQCLIEQNFRIPLHSSNNCALFLWVAAGSVFIRYVAWNVPVYCLLSVYRSTLSTSRENTRHHCLIGTYIFCLLTTFRSRLSDKGVLRSTLFALHHICTTQHFIYTRTFEILVSLMPKRIFCPDKKIIWPGSAREGLFMPCFDRSCENSRPKRD